MTKINAAKFQEIAKPLSKRCSAILSQMPSLPPLQAAMQTSTSTTIPDTLPALWSTFLNDLSELLASSSAMVNIIREYFTNPKLEIDRVYSDEIIKFYVGVINAINVICVSLFRWVEVLPPSATKTLLLQQEIALLSLNLKFTGLITNNYFYDNTRRHQVMGFDHELQANFIFLKNRNPTKLSFNSTKYPKLLQDTFFSLGRSYEILGDLALAEIHYTESEMMLESLIGRQSHARDDLELTMRRNELFGRLAFLNFKLKRYYASRQLFDRCIALSTASDRATSQQEIVINIYSVDAVKLFIPMIIQYEQTGQFDQALYICNIAPGYYQQHKKMATDSTFNYAMSIQQVARLATQIRQKYRTQITTWTSELPQGIAIDCNDNSCRITILDTTLLANLPADFATSFYLQKEKSGVFSIPDFATYPMRRISQLFKELKQLSLDSQRVRVASTRRKHNSHIDTSELADIAPVVPELNEECHASSATSSTTEPKTEKIKTRGVATVVPEIPQAPVAGLTTRDIIYDQGTESPPSPCTLHRLRSRTLPLGPYAYTSKAKIAAFFSEYPDISDKAESIVTAGKIVPRFGEQGIKYCRKENASYLCKIKFLGHYGNSRIYGRTVGVIRDETGDVPVIEFSHCVRKAH